MVDFIVNKGHPTQALTQFKKKLKRCTLYVARINNSGEIRCAKPCITCSSLIRYFGIKRVVFIGSSGNAVKTKGCNMHSQHMCKGLKFKLGVWER